MAIIHVAFHDSLTSMQQPYRSHTVYKIGLERKGKIRRAWLESSEDESDNILFPNYDNILNFGNSAFFVMCSFQASHQILYFFKINLNICARPFRTLLLV